MYSKVGRHRHVKMMKKDKWREREIIIHKNGIVSNCQAFLKYKEWRIPFYEQTASYGSIHIYIDMSSSYIYTYNVYSIYIWYKHLFWSVLTWPYVSLFILWDTYKFNIILNITNVSYPIQLMWICDMECERFTSMSRF